MQTYILDLEMLLFLLDEAGQSGSLSTELPSGVPGFKERCRVKIDLREGKIVLCQIEGRNGRILAFGRDALQRVANLGSREWQLVETPPSESLSPSSSAAMSPRPGQYVRPPTLVPRRVAFIDQGALDRLPRRSRHVLNLVDGTRSIERIAVLLHAAADEQSMRYVVEIMQELERLGMVTF